MSEIVKYLHEIGQLKRIARAGWWMAGISNPESVAEHSFRTAILGYILANLDGADPAKTTIMCLFHDVHEARMNDLHKVGRRCADGENIEERASAEQLTRLPKYIAEGLVSLRSEFGDGESLEAQLARDADLLECLIQAREYQAQGYQYALDWIEGCYSALVTESAKRIANECLQLVPCHTGYDG